VHPGPTGLSCLSVGSPGAKHVEIYIFRRRARGWEVLLLRRSPGRSLAGVWQPVTGKIRRGESILRAAAREVLEETGLVPVRWWLLETPSLHFDRKTWEVCTLPRFAAEVTAGEPVRRSSEHTDHEFVSARTAGRRVLWDSQREGLRALARQVIRGGRLARALEISTREPARMRRSR
jgi:8-oxo-dGTP pyrophosphatase MutT (NUDIX family)